MMHIKNVFIVTCYKLYSSSIITNLLICRMITGIVYMFVLIIEQLMCIS